MKDMNLKNIDRRKFINRAAIFTGGMLTPFSTIGNFTLPFLKNESGSKSMNSTAENLFGDISTVPNFCTHEHWGSISSIGSAQSQGGFRCDTTAGAQPLRATSIWDLVLDPYEEGWMAVQKRHPDDFAKEAGQISMRQWWTTSPQGALKKFHSLINSSVMTGAFQCTRKGILHLYGIDISDFELQDWIKVDKLIKNNYADIFTWHIQAMRKAYFSEVIRPVHPEFYTQEESHASKIKEMSIIHTVMRIDPLLDLWRESSPRRDALYKIVGIDPFDANSWREFIKRLFDLAAENHAVGIKQLQAYRRSLLYLPRTDTEVLFRGKLDEVDILKFQDWVMHECCKQAHERKWIHQVHVGTNNITESSPMPLRSLATKYPQMNIVMIHCWPFLKEAGWLAKFVPNIYIDTCWLPVLNPEFLREGFASWLNYVPTHKIMLAHDSTHIEMAVGSSLFTRKILSESLAYQQKFLQLTNRYMRAVAADMLNNNAVHLYKIGKEVTF